MRILLLFTGGTIGSAELDGRIVSDPMAKRILLQKYRAKTGDSTSFDEEEPFSLLSEQMTFSHIATLADLVCQRRSHYDGIVILHGSDTLAYTAAALSYVLGKTAPPVVLVASNYPLSDPRQDGVDNFAAAIALLRTGCAEGVFVSMRKQTEQDTVLLLRGSRLLGHLPYGNELFYLGSAAAHCKNGAIIRHPSDEMPDEIAPIPSAGLPSATGKILWIHPTPGMCYPEIPKDCRGILHGSYHSGTLRTDPSLAAFLAKARERKIPVFLAGSGANRLPYESLLSPYLEGMQILPPFSPLAAYVKLSLLASAGRDLAGEAPKSLGGDRILGL